MGTVYEVEISADRKVELKELSGLELHRCVELSGGGEKGWDMMLYGLRFSIVKDNGQPVQYTDLIGGKLLERFSAKELNSLAQAYGQINSPSEEDQGRVRSMKVVASS